MDFEFMETVDKASDNMLAIFALTILSFTIAKFKILSPETTSAALIFLGAPIYLKIIAGLIGNNEGGYAKFKGSHGAISLLVIPYLIYLLYNYPFAIPDLPMLTVSYLTGFLIMYLTFRLFLIFYRTFGMKDKNFRERFFFLTITTYGTALIAILIIREAVRMSIFVFGVIA